MDTLLFVAVGLEVAVSVVALLIYFEPLSWRFGRVSVSVPQEVRDSVDEIFESLRRASTSFSIVDPLMFPTIPEPQVVKTLSLETCPTCGLTGEGLAEHLDQSRHGKNLDNYDEYRKTGDSELTIGVSPVLCDECGEPVGELKRVSKTLSIRHSHHNHKKSEGYVQ